MKNARFWVHVNDDVVKLTMKAGEIITHRYIVPGQIIFSQVWFFDPNGKHVEYTWHQGIHLADGWYHDKSRLYCKVGELAQWEEERLLFPNWKVQQ